MMFLEGMGPRQSIASELLDTVRFGGLDKIKATRNGPGYTKRQVGNGDAYVIPFGTSGKEFGAVLVRAPKSIEVRMSINGKKSSKKFKSCYETKRFLIQAFVCEY
jgi:hypothetical protein